MSIELSFEKVYGVESIDSTDGLFFDLLKE